MNLVHQRVGRFSSAVFFGLVKTAHGVMATAGTSI
jgi:hypothetical protein